MLGVNNPMQDQIGDVEATEGEYCLSDNQAPDIVMHMMAQLMSQHNLNFVGGVAIKHSIADHDAARVAQAHQSGIGGSSLIAHFHRKDPAYPGMSAIGER